MNEQAEEWNIQYQILNLRIDLLSAALPPNSWNSALAHLYQDLAQLLAQRPGSSDSGYTQLCMFVQESPHLVIERNISDV